jgi:hypothetical protein
MKERDLPGEQPQSDPPRDESGYLLRRHIARPFDPVLKRLQGDEEPAPVPPPDPETPEGQVQIQAWRENPPLSEDVDFWNRVHRQRHEENQQLRLARRRLKAQLGKREFTRQRNRGELWSLYYHLIH